MKNKISVVCILLIQILSPGRSFSQEDFKFRNDSFYQLQTLIGGEFIGQIPALEKKDQAGSVLFKTEEGILQIKVCGLINPDTRNNVTLRLYATQIKRNELDITGLIGNSTIAYQINETGFGILISNDLNNREYTIKTRLKLTAVGYPEFFLEFPVIIKTTSAGNIDDTESFISENMEHFIFYKTNKNL